MTANFQLRAWFTRSMAVRVASVTEAVSFVIHCETQQEIDHYWDKLTAGGKPVQCGWLKDKFGLSWQVVPDVLPRLLKDPDPKKSQRVMKAMMQMVKIDIARLQQAADQA
jgi:predicted 3-demethylubiquinone-9 3-methyltransferase (glyoxalase superfamily)